MARQLKRLTARTVAALKSPGRHADGQNLYLTISNLSTSSGGGGVSKRWTFMYSFAGKQREAGLGPVAGVALAQARDKAAGYRSMLTKGIGPAGRKEGRSGGRGGAQNVRPVRR
jgi:Arm domain-containing DNA-binding protein